MLSWSPGGGALLLETDEGAIGISTSVTVVDDFVSATITNCTLTQPSPLFTASVVGGSVTITAGSTKSLFPILGIGYVTEGVTGVCYEWEDLPESAGAVYTYTKTKGGPFTVDVSVTALGTDALGETSVEETNSYQILVWPNYDGGKLALIAAVAQRS